MIFISYFFEIVLRHTESMKSTFLNSSNIFISFYLNLVARLNKSSFRFSPHENFVSTLTQRKSKDDVAFNNSRTHWAKKINCNLDYSLKMIKAKDDFLN